MKSTPRNILEEKARLRHTTMGASQSSGGGGGKRAAAAEVKTSYYELLGVQRQASDDEIKKAYRKKALELHPDRNYENVDSATKLFAEVQAAYEVLSDPQERAWYDSHESAILRGDDGTNDEQHYEQNVKVTTADDLARMVRKFNSGVEFTDAPSGFFGFLRETFDHLKQEEEIAADWEDVDLPDYPSFGHKDDGDDVVKPFYAMWSSFATRKTFAWKDKYRLSEAPDRRYRRLMEKENQASREEGKREFNDAVKALVAFVRKRDPRYVTNIQTEEERQKTLRDATAAQAARARAANEAKLKAEVPEWTKVRDPSPDEHEGTFEEEESEEEVFECVACNKTFKSEKQWEAHEKSKKHQKAIQALQRKMRKDNKHLHLDSELSSSGVATPATEEDEEELLDEVVAATESELDSNVADIKDGEESVDGEAHEVEKGSPDKHRGSEGDVVEEDKNASAIKENPEQEDDASEFDDEDEDYASPEAIQARLQDTSLDTPSAEVSGDDDNKQSSKPKLGKAAQKRAKRAAAAVAAEQSDGSSNHKCATCNSAFPSKTRLFQHIKDFGHAAPKPDYPGSGKGKKGKGKK